MASELPASGPDHSIEQPKQPFRVILPSESSDQAEALIIQCLLHEIPDDQITEVENAYFGNDDLYNFYEGVQYQLIEQYSKGVLSTERTQRFKTFGLDNPGKQQRLDTTRAIETLINGTQAEK